MKRLRHIFTALLALSLWSCEIPFDLDQDGEAMLYVQCFAEADSITVLPHLASPINGAALPEVSAVEIDLQLNGKAIPVQADGPNRFLARGVALQGGDALSLSLSAKGLPAAKGHTVIPARPEVVDFSWEEVKVDTIKATQVHLTLDHAPGETDFYGIRIRREDEYLLLNGTTVQYQSYITPGYILTAAESGQFDLADFVQLNFDSRSLQGNTVDMPFTLITAKQFEGSTYSFYLNSFDASILNGIRDSMPSGDTGMIGGGIVSGDVGSGDGEQPVMDPSLLPVSYRTRYYFSFYHLSEEFYYYAKAQYQSNFDFLANMGLIPANFTWSNVDGGLGFVGALQSTTLGPLEMPQEVAEEN